MLSLCNVRNGEAASSRRKSRNKKAQLYDVQVVIDVVQCYFLSSKLIPMKMKHRNASLHSLLSESYVLIQTHFIFVAMNSERHHAGGSPSQSICHCNAYVV